MKLRFLCVSALLATALASCANTPREGSGFDWMRGAGPTGIDISSDPEETTGAGGPAALSGQEDSERTTGETQVRTIPPVGNGTAQTSRYDPETEALEGPAVNVTLPPQPVPSFINTVFGEILEEPFTLGPEVSERTDVISLRSVNDMPPQTFLALVREALKDYGLAIVYENGLFRVVSMDELRAQMPQFVRSRARPQVPSDLRPIVQFVELTAIDSADMQTILEQAFPERNRLTIRINRATNSMVLSGLSDTVDAALTIVEQMDELRFAGTQVITYTPRNWTVEDMARDLQSILSIEGYYVALGAGQPRAITLLPLSVSNQLMVFARERSLANHVIATARQLDAAAFEAEARTPHVYQVQNGNAEALAEVINAALGQTRLGTPGGGGDSEGGEPLSSGNRQSRSGEGGLVSGGAGGVTVDTTGNRIIYFGTQAEYDQLVSLMRQLDTPSPEVMIEVTIAEVTLTDNLSFGLDAVFDTDFASTFAANIETDGGITAVVDTGQVNLTGTANSDSSQINILSTPRIITRSGSEGSVQVGTDVPVITSQRAADSQSGGNSDVLQTVQYRSTGIILNVTPLVYSNNRIDLQISQEVSSAETNDNTAIASPIISNRSMTSELSLQDGQTAVLGGLIENRFTRGNGGVPFLKDVPVIGSAFGSESFSSTRTMLVVLVTPYILNSRADRQRVVDTLVSAINTGFENQTSASPTLRAPSEPMQIRAWTGGDAAED
ncbi:MAG: secretin N-terminal domain-containing protein [Pseudomonadota bacterium]|nr:secretin N-terminal domain-containing protein [Pseudomonadota bacterium]